ncbi:Dimeric alpha+beta barrel [Glarea lozoyensis ATCC 20868]|uniref:Dimeric alpha+beta barrel n=2 Tax=Glarea lozoyensis TaxID=101852 RepID=S3CHH1_GLAL2|nr:Dimeric alpha+beta barrel [Glarea lozoyensis ATCC 20868]EHL02568.1 hypothetical protein M7I_1362 [Glarea lozoyensis 74030]EPE25917.1 Dimeric alpha+beta barrel [Glarea lozoyensis ATCC 20868]
MAQKAVKITIMFKKLDTITNEEFHSHWSNVHPKIFLGVKIVQEKIIKYAQHHVNNEVSEGLKAAGLPVADYDGCAEIYARSVEELMSVFQDEEYLRVVVPDEMRFLKRDEAKMILGWEDVLFDDGEVKSV